MKKIIFILMITFTLVGCAIPSMQDDIKNLQQRTEEQEQKLKAQEEQNASQDEKIKDYEARLDLIEQYFAELKETQNELLKRCEVEVGNVYEVYYWEGEKLIYLHSSDCTDTFEFVYDKDGKLKVVLKTTLSADLGITTHQIAPNPMEAGYNICDSNGNTQSYDVPYRIFKEYLQKVWEK